jgi:hypothetical protein
MNHRGRESPTEMNHYEFPLGVRLSLVRDSKARLDDVNLKLGWFAASMGEGDNRAAITMAGSSHPPVGDVAGMGVGEGLEVWPDGFHFSCRSRITDCRVVLRGMLDFSFDIQYMESHGPLRDAYDKDYLAQMLSLQCLERIYWMRDSSLIHGGSVSKNGKAVLFVGRGGSRKTSLILNLVRHHGFAFMGDDRSLVCGLDVYPFPLSSGFAAFSLMNLDREDIGFVDKMRFLTGRPWRADDVRGGGFAREKAKLGAVIFLENSGPTAGRDIICGIDGGERDKLSANNELEEMECTKSVGVEDGVMWRAFAAYASRYPDSMEARFRSGRLTEKVQSAILSVARYRLQTSRDSLDVQCDRISTMMEGL